MVCGHILVLILKKDSVEGVIEEHLQVRVGVKLSAILIKLQIQPRPLHWSERSISRLPTPIEK